jgi:hypothetical protein
VIVIRQLNVLAVRFGLLHRIPPIPENREPGAIPPELIEHAEEYEEHQLFVPADAMENSEQAEEQLRWEQEEWERENYARNYAAAVNQRSPSAYDPPLDSERNISNNRADFDFEDSFVNLSEASPGAFPAHSLPADRGGSARGVLESPIKDISRMNTPICTPLISPRASTPTQNRTFGYHVNSEFNEFSS